MKENNKEIYCDICSHAEVCIYKIRQSWSFPCKFFDLIRKELTIQKNERQPQNRTLS